MADLNESGFTDDQTSYLSGFISGVLQSQSLPFLGQDSSSRFTHEPSRAVETVHGTPLDELCREEVIKHEQHGLDCFDTMLANAASNSFPQGGDIFRYKYHGLFFVSPAEESLMLRCRIAGGALLSSQLRGLSQIAQEFGTGHADLTTRANVQIRGIMPPAVPEVLTRLAELGLTSQGAGADNVRNVTATPTSGFDPVEFIDVLPFAKAMHHYILRNRDLYGLPRKFNISYDSGGRVSTCTDTNDIGFYAVRVAEGDHGVSPGIYFRMQLCGITGHQQFATDCGLLLTPEESLPVAAALIRVYIENGDRTNRKRARLKYLVDDWGVEKLLEKTSEKLAFPLRRLPLDACESFLSKSKHGHLGIHPQNDGKNYLGILMPVGRMSSDQMTQLADIADGYGRGEVRLTVWQNMIIPGIPDAQVEPAVFAVQAAGFDHRASAITGGIVACTGSRGCKYAAADTKGNAIRLGEYLTQKLELDQPVNIHLTGCPHSCAQHYIGDIGMIGVKVKSASGESLEGYNIVLGGGVDDRQAIAREVWKGIPFNDAPALLEPLLRAYLANRIESETFSSFANRHQVEQLRDLIKVSQDAAA